MLFSTSVRAALWVLFGLVLVAVFVYLAIDLGFVDWAFDRGTKPWLDAQKAWLSDKYGINRDSIDYSLKIVGITITAIFGMLKLLQAWHFAKGNLPLRLQQYVD